MMRLEDTLENKNLYVRNIPYTVTEEDLKKLFGQFGNITSIKLEGDLVENKDNNEKKKFINKGFGYVSFDTIENAKKALESLNGKYMKGFESWTKPNQYKPPYMWNQGNYKNNGYNNYRQKYNNNGYQYRGRGGHRGGYNKNKNYQKKNSNNNDKNENSTNTNAKEEKKEFDFESFNKLTTNEEKKEFLGERLFAAIQENLNIAGQNVDIDIIGKITGMIIEIPDDNEIIEILQKPSALDSRIKEALSLLNKK